MQQLASSSSFHERKSLIIQRREVSSLSDTAAIITSIPTISPYFIVRVLFIYTYAYIFFLLDDRRRENRDDSRPRCVSIFGKRRMVGQKLEKSVTESTNEADEDRGLSDKKGRLDDL